METAPLVGREACTADDDVILIRDTLLLVGMYRCEKYAWKLIRCSVSRAEALSLGVHPLSVEWVFAALPE